MPIHPYLILLLNQTFNVYALNPEREDGFLFFKNLSKLVNQGFDLNG